MPEIPSLGRRGGGWVVLQFALMAAVLVAAVTGPRWPESVSAALAVVGAVLTLAGAVLVVQSSRVLGRSLTPFPLPSEVGRLVVLGPYRVVRHPIYAGGALFFAGFSLALSPVALALTGALVILWALKLQVEERFLRAAYPGYAAYCGMTRFRLLPFVY